MDIRKFYLQNAAGERIDLNGAEGIWATDPSGLGEELSPVWGNLNGGFFMVLSDEAEPQTPVGLVIKFTRRATAYAQFQSLARWISAAGTDLLLLYAPYGSTVYYRRVRLQYLKKEERNSVGWLECPAAFRPSTPWYLPTSAPASMDVPGQDAMRYDSGFRYGSARYLGSHAATYTAVFQPAGDIPGGVELTFLGEAVNPVLTLTGLSTGTVYGRCEISRTLQAGDELRYSSSPRDSYCRLIRSGQVTDLDDDLDPAADPYFRMPLTEACSLALTAQSIDGAAQARVNYYYRTV